MRHPWRGLEGLPRGVWVLAATTLVNRLGTMALPFLVLYLTRFLGFGAGRAGSVVAAYGLAAIASGPLAGRLCLSAALLLRVSPPPAAARHGQGDPAPAPTQDPI